MEKKTIIISYPRDDKAQRLLKSYKRKDAKQSLLILFNKIQKCSTRPDEEGYFDVPAMLLKKVRTNYKGYVNKMKKAGMLSVKTSNHLVRKPTKEDMCNQEFIKKESYSTTYNQCKKFKFTFDDSLGYDEFTIEEKYSLPNWWQLLHRSLIALGIEDIRISRDTFSRRVHHNLSARVEDEQIDSYQKDNYKNFIKAYFPGLYTIVDAIACQPTLLPLLFTFVDVAYQEAIKSPDFYLYIANQLELTGANRRDVAKSRFNVWAMSTHYLTSPLNKLFPLINKLKIIEVTKGGPKNMSKKMQRLEVKYFIDEGLNNIEKDLDIDFCVTIHDSMIVENAVAQKVKEYMEAKTPFKFKLEEL